MAGKRKRSTSETTSKAGSKAKAPKVKRSFTDRLLFRNRSKRSWKQRLKRFAVVTFTTGLVFTLIVFGVFVYLYKAIDIPQPNAEFLTQTTYVYYDDGKDEAGRFATQLRDSVSLDDMAVDLKEAVVAAENRTFYTDSGIDPQGILRAVFNNASGNSTQGASTITQQYVKILYLTQEQSYKRKVKEAVQSLKVQRTQSKDEVLENYLNLIYFGRGAYGVEAAANVFFGIKAADLNLRQSAVLAAVLNNPTRFDPDNGPDAKRALKGRYDYVLDSMAETDKISNDEAVQAKERLPKFPDLPVESSYGLQKGHVLTMVKKAMLGLKSKDGEYFTEEEINGGGLRITTTLTRKATTRATRNSRAA